FGRRLRAADRGVPPLVRRIPPGVSARAAHAPARPRAARGARGGSARSAASRAGLLPLLHLRGGCDEGPHPRRGRRPCRGGDLPGRPGTDGGPRLAAAAVMAAGGSLPIGQVAKRAGVHVQTVRYYERRGLLAPPPRRPSAQRAYEPGVVDVLRVVKRAQRVG